jgi:hypothetical protein
MSLASSTWLGLHEGGYCGEGCMVGWVGWKNAKSSKKPTVLEMVVGRRYKVGSLVTEPSGSPWLCIERPRGSKIQGHLTMCWIADLLSRVGVAGMAMNGEKEDIQV